MENHRYGVVVMEEIILVLVALGIFGATGSVVATLFWIFIAIPLIFVFISKFFR